MNKTVLLLLAALTISGCVPREVPEVAVANVMPEPITKTRVDELVNITGPAGEPIVISVYNFNDKTGQRKPSDKIATLSSAVTQGAEVFLIKALQDAGKGKWFRPVERVGLDNLIKERQLIRNQRETYEGKDAKPLSPMLISGVMIEGGIVGYDSNVTTGGVGAALLGIGVSSQYNVDVVTVVMRLISVHTGEVLVSSGATKTILSAGMGGTVTKFIDQGTMSLQLEAGATGNEPATYAVRLAVEAAVVDMIKQGATKGLWSYAKSERAKPKKNP